MGFFISGTELRNWLAKKKIHKKIHRVQEAIDGLNEMCDWINNKIQKRKEKAMESALTQVNNELEELRKTQEDFEKKIRDADAEILRLPVEDAAALARVYTERDFLRRKVEVIKASITVLTDEAQTLRTAQNSQPVVRTLNKASRAKKNYF